MINSRDSLIETSFGPPKRRSRSKKVASEEFSDLGAPPEVESFNNNLSAIPETNQIKNNMTTRKAIIITAIISLILGAAIALSSYFVYYVVIRMHDQVNQNTANISQIVDFLNKNIQGQPAAGAPAAKSK